MAGRAGGTSSSASQRARVTNARSRGGGRAAAALAAGRRRGAKWAENRAADWSPAHKMSRVIREFGVETMRCDPPREDVWDPTENAFKLNDVTGTTEAWGMMCAKDHSYGPRANPLKAHPSITSRARTIVIDWLMDVSTVEKLHRETFHLAVDYLDRYLASFTSEVGDGVPLAQLQMLGTTALFVAAKYEEIYPPGVDRFVEYADGACEEQQVRECELSLLERLSFLMSPVTALNWLTLFMKLLGEKESQVKLEQHEEKILHEVSSLVPPLLRNDYLHFAAILDMCLLDDGSTQFSYRELAAGVLFYSYEPYSVVEYVTGLEYGEQSAVVEWLTPFCIVAERYRALGDPIRPRKGVPIEDWHNIQTKYSLEIDQLLTEILEERQSLKESRTRRHNSRPPLRRVAYHYSP